MQFYYYLNGQKLGPVSLEDLKALVKNGTITRDTILENKKGMRLKAGKIPNLFPAEREESPFVQSPKEAEPSSFQPEGRRMPAFSAPSANDPEPMYASASYRDSDTDLDPIAEPKMPIKPLREPPASLMIVARILKILSWVSAVLGGLIALASILYGTIGFFVNAHAYGLSFDSFAIMLGGFVGAIITILYTLLFVLLYSFIRSLIEWLCNTQEDLSLVRAYLEKKWLEE